MACVRLKVRPWRRSRGRGAAGPGRRGRRAEHSTVGLAYTPAAFLLSAVFTPPPDYRKPAGRRAPRRPLGRAPRGTRLRYANLPVGGTIALGASLVAPSRVAGFLRALGLAALAGAVGYGVFDPLPPVA
jgi:hypothetical protein